jgi:drug/metabolite transporter (DMT)-like permease
MTHSAPTNGARVGKLVAAFAAVYLLWGSTYLGIRIAIETLPPFLMAGVRFLLAGAILVTWARLRGEKLPPWREWRPAVIIGALLLLGGNGGVVWAEQFVPSGKAALLITTEPLWIVVLAWSLPGGRRPTAGVALGMLLGITGVGILVGPGQFLSGEAVHPAGAMALCLASLSWAAGSMYSSRVHLRVSGVLATGMQMLCGGALQLAASGALGEWRTFDPAGVSLRSVVAVAYLLVFGSIVGFTAYFYLLRNVSPSRASTYAFVNPVVAVLLGWLIAGEPLTPRVALATAVIVAAVMLVILRGEAVEHGTLDAACAEGKDVAVSSKPGDEPPSTEKPPQLARDRA